MNIEQIMALADAYADADCLGLNAEGYGTRTEVAAMQKARAALEAALREALQPQEPVAWYDSISGVTDFTSFKPSRKPSVPGAEWLPLYAQPVAVQLSTE